MNFKNKLVKEDFYKSTLLNDRTGEKYGKLTIVSYAGIRYKSTYWNCICDCGNKTIKRTNSILHSRGFSACDKCLSSTGNKSSAWRGHGEIGRSFMTTYKSSAKERGFEFNISIEYIWELFLRQNRRCALSGKELRFNTSYDSKDRTASLDRIDSTLGYIEGNVQWVHTDFNWLKKSYQNEEFIDMCIAVAKNFGYRK